MSGRAVDSFPSPPISLSPYTMRLLSLLLLTGLLAWPAWAQTGRFATEATTVDFGALEEGTVVQHTFVFWNEGSAPLQLRETKASCGCTVPTWTREAVAPGDSGEVMIAFLSAGHPGPFRKFVRLDTDGEPERVYLVVEGVVTPPPLVEAEAQGHLLVETPEADLGAVTPGLHTAAIRLQNMAAQPLLIERATASSENVIVRVPTGPLLPEEITTLLVTVDTAALADEPAFRYRIVLDTDDAEQPQKTVHVVGTVANR